MTKAKTKPKKPPMQMVNLRMDKELLKDLQVLADASGRSRSNLMKFALAEYVSKNYP